MKNSFFYRFLIGIVIGAANIIPCVSGGTIMVICGVFDDIMHSIGSFFKNTKKSIIYLLPMFVGAGVGVISLAGIITYMLENYYMIINFLFVGIILGSVPLILKSCSFENFKYTQLIPMLLGFLIMIATMLVFTDDSGNVIRILNFSAFFKLLLSSAVAAFCMIIPGISGSFVLLLLGVYTTVTTALSEFNIVVLIPVALGVGMGVLFGSMIIDRLIRNFKNATYLAILGLMLGSVPSVFFSIAEKQAYRLNIELIIAIFSVVIGFILSYKFSEKKE